MGDLSVEPSMEEILSSIKRIIAEEGELPGRARRIGRPSPDPVARAAAADEVLELSDPMPATPIAAELSRRAQVQAATPPPPFPMADEAGGHSDPEPDVATPPAPTPVPAAAAAPVPAPAASPSIAESASEPLVSPQTAEASRGALDNLSRLVVTPAPATDGTLEGMVREMLRPMLREWLDARLPAMVETMVAAEITRITRQRE